MTDYLAKQLGWFVDHLDEPPGRLHQRGVWSDPEDGAGSAIGSPAWAREFRDWLERGEWARVEERTTEPCPHSLRAGIGLCPTCGVRDAAGNVVAETGVVSRTRTRYRYPMRAAIAKTRGVQVRRGRPPLSVLLAQIARARGDVEAAVDTLAPTWPVLRDPVIARAHLGFALTAVRQRYRVDAPPPRARDISDAQADAEARSPAAGVHA